MVGLRMGNVKKLHSIRREKFGSKKNSNFFKVFGSQNFVSGNLLSMFARRKYIKYFINQINRGRLKKKENRRRLNKKDSKRNNKLKI